MDHVLFDKDSISFPRDGGVASVHRQQIRLRDYRAICRLPARVAPDTTFRRLCDTLARQDLFMVVASGGHAMDCDCFRRKLEALADLPEHRSWKPLEIVFGEQAVAVKQDEDIPIDAPLDAKGECPLEDFVVRVLNIGIALAQMKQRGGS